MRVIPNYEKCPYTLKLLSELDDVNVEHIFPDAIGGVKDYSVKVSTDVNSQLGTRIDAPLINSFPISILRFLNGIKSRSGKPSIRMKGNEVKSGREFEIEIPYEGDVEIHIRKPVELASDKKSGTIIIKPDERDSFLRKFLDNHKRKGHAVRIDGETKGQIDLIEVLMEIDILALKRAMFKIAYLAVYCYLGDRFLDDPLIVEWHKAFLSPDENDTYNANISGLPPFDDSDPMKMFMPPIQQYEHAATVVNLKQDGPVVAVSLFGGSLHTLISIASETSNYDLDEGEGLIAICNAKTGKTRFINFMDYFAQIANGINHGSKQ